jgi:hypothetical protein
MNRGIATASPWIAFLRKRGTLNEISRLLSEAGQEYRRLYGVKPKYKTAAERRKTKIENAIKAVEDEEIQKLLQAEFGDKFNKAYIADAVKALHKELGHLQMLIDWKAPPQQPPPQPSSQQAKGYGLREGLGYGYGYFY